MDHADTYGFDQDGSALLEDFSHGPIVLGDLLASLSAVMEVADLPVADARRLFDLESLADALFPGGASFDAMGAVITAYSWDSFVCAARDSVKLDGLGALLAVTLAV